MSINFTFKLVYPWMRVKVLSRFFSIASSEISCQVISKSQTKSALLSTTLTDKILGQLSIGEFKKGFDPNSVRVLGLAHYTQNSFQATTVEKICQDLSSYYCLLEP